MKLNRLGFRLQGDMNWHAHCGIFTYPMQMAVSYRIPLIIWGEHGFMDLGGMYSLNDFVEITAKPGSSTLMRGFDWHDFTDRGARRARGRAQRREGPALGAVPERR